MIQEDDDDDEEDKDKDDDRVRPERKMNEVKCSVAVYPKGQVSSYEVFHVWVVDLGRPPVQWAMRQV